MVPIPVEECKPLIRVQSVRDVIVPHFGLQGSARENGALADVADEAETEVLWWDIDRHSPGG